MLSRLLFASQAGWKHRRALQALPAAKNIFAVDWSALLDSGVQVLALDFDGVLAADGQVEIAADVCTLLHALSAIFGNQIYILSNQPKQQRQEFFATHFPHFSFIVAKKKPYPDGLWAIQAHAHCQAHEIVLIDDRVLTGGLATILAGTQCGLIAEPYTNFTKNFWRETAFLWLRCLERCLFR